MGSLPSPWQRLVAYLRGEVSAAALEAYRRASLPVYELMDEVERRRLQYAVAGMDAWTVPPAVRAETVCAWNAFVLQSLGDAIVDADYRESPATAGFVPRETAEQVLRFYGGVEGWLNLAHQARANPAFRLKVRVPAPLPAWALASSPRSHLHGLLAALRSLESHASAAVERLSTPGPEQRAWKGQLAVILQAHASAVTSARYAEELCGAGLVDEVRVRAEPHVRRAIEQLFHVGQLAADPHRAEIDALPREASAPPSAKGAPSAPPAPRRRGVSARPAPPPPTWPPAVAKMHAPKEPAEWEPPTAEEIAARAAVEADPGAPETLEDTGLTIRDRFGVHVAPGTRIRHNVLGPGLYVGIGSRGSVFMQKDGGQLITFADRYFVAEYRA
jgi:hypothetical protein